MQEERKTLDERQKMTDLQRLRHSASHVLATAILKIWPEAQFAAGPPVENGFYYDVDLPHRISPDDFEKIEAEMKKEIKANHPFERIEVSRDEALELGKKGRLAALSERPEPSEFKVDIIENIPRDEKISLYRSGDFIDLCAGPHVMRTGNIARESLYRKSGHVPYYLESMFPPMTLVEDKDKKQVEKANAMIAYFENYGGDAWQRVLEDAESGNLSDPAKKQDLLIQLELVRSAERADETKLRELKQFAASIGDRYYLKAMNCPHHHKLFAALPRSYRDLPLRLAEYGTDYRYEKSGELFGLMRVRSLQMNDAHLYMTPDQFEAEFNAVNEM